MITARMLTQAAAILAKYLARTKENVARPDRVYVQVDKHEMQVLLQLAVVGLSAFRRQLDKSA